MIVIFLEEMRTKNTFRKSVTYFCMNFNIYRMQKIEQQTAKTLFSDKLTAFVKISAF